MKIGPTRSLALAILTAVVAIGLTGHAQSPVVAPDARDQAKWQLAVNAAARQVMDARQAFPATMATNQVLLTDELATFMENDVAGHQKPDDSRKRCAGLVYQAAWHSFYLSLSNIVATAGDRSPLPISTSLVLNKIGPDWSNRVDRAIAQFTSNHVEALFVHARKRAVAVQRQTIDSGVHYPSQTELDTQLTELARKSSTVDQLGPAEFANMGKWLEGYAGGSQQPVFDENQAFIQSQAIRLRDEIRRQYGVQIAVLKTNRRDAALRAAFITRAAIAAELKRQLDLRLVSEQQTLRIGAAAEALPIYREFSVVQASRISDSARLEKQRLLTFVRGAMPALVKPQDMRAQITNDLPAHHASGQSETNLTGHLAAVLKMPLAVRYSQKAAGTNAVAVKQLPTYFDRRLTADGDIAADYAAIIKDRIHKLLPDVRASIAADQLRDWFPGLSLTNVLRETTIAKTKDRDNRIDSYQQARDVLGLDGRTTLPRARQALLLEETMSNVVAITSALFARGNQAMEKQLALLRSMETNRLDQLQAEVTSGRSRRDISAEWTQALMGQWTAQTNQLPVLYPALFDRTRHELDKAVRQFYNTAKKESAIARRTRHQTPAHQDSKAPTPDVLPEQKPLPSQRQSEGISQPQPAKRRQPGDHVDLFLVLDKTDTPQCQATLYSAATSQLAAVSFKPAEIDSSVKRIMAEFRPRLEAAFKTRYAQARTEYSGFFLFRKRSLPELSLAVIIKSPAIRHMMTLRLREQLQDMAARWSAENYPDEPPLGLDWKVGL